MRRKIDELGRIVLPKEYRNALNLKEKDEVNLSLEIDTITIRKTIPCCHFCNSSANLVQIGSEAVCKSCFQRLYKELEDKR